VEAGHFSTAVEVGAQRPRGALAQEVGARVQSAHSHRVAGVEALRASPKGAAAPSATKAPPACCPLAVVAAPLLVEEAPLSQKLLCWAGAVGQSFDRVGAAALVG